MKHFLHWYVLEIISNDVVIVGLGSKVNAADFANHKTP